MAHVRLVSVRRHGVLSIATRVDSAIQYPRSSCLTVLGSLISQFPHWSQLEITAAKLRSWIMQLHPGGEPEIGSHSIILCQNTGAIFASQKETEVGTPSRCVIIVKGTVASSTE